MLGKALQIAAGANNIIWPDISTATHIRFDTVNVSGSRVLGLFFKPDGTKIYTLTSTDDTIVETTLSTAWDISTHGSADASLVTDQTHNPSPYGLFINDDGTELYTSDLSKHIVQYSMTTAWDLSTASYTRKFSTSAQTGTTIGVGFGGNGKNMYSVDASGYVYRYTLSTAWDISTATSDSTSADTDYSPRHVYLKPDGTKIFITDSSADTLKQYDLSTPYVITGVDNTTPDSSFVTTTQETAPYAMFISPDGAYLYVGGDTDDGVDQYSLG
jgi:DNA-binding beta-propeller fold protein YncE